VTPQHPTSRKKTEMRRRHEKKGDTALLPMRKSDFPCYSRRGTVILLYGVFGYEDSNRAIFISI